MSSSVILGPHHSLVGWFEISTGTAWVSSQVRSCGIYDGQFDNGARFF
jgi:hypothetical protein